jgi:hypothetical protein
MRIWLHVKSISDDDENEGWKNLPTEVFLADFRGVNNFEERCKLWSRYSPEQVSIHVYEPNHFQKWDIINLSKSSKETPFVHPTTDQSRGVVCVAPDRLIVFSTKSLKQFFEGDERLGEVSDIFDSMETLLPFKIPQQKK